MFVSNLLVGDPKVCSLVRPTGVVGIPIFDRPLQSNARKRRFSPNRLYLELA